MRERMSQKSFFKWKSGWKSHKGDIIKLTDVRQEREHAITMKRGTSVIHTGHTSLSRTFRDPEGLFFFICVTPWHFFNLIARNSLGKNLQWHECHLILVFIASLLVIRLAKAILLLFYSQVLWLIRSKCWHGCSTLRRTRSPSSNPVTWLLEY